MLSSLVSERSWNGIISSQISELLMNTWGVWVPGDEREETIPPTSDTDDVLREQQDTDWEFLKDVELFEFRREKSFEVRRDDSFYGNFNFTHILFCYKLLLLLTKSVLLNRNCNLSSYTSQSLKFSYYFRLRQWILDIKEYYRNIISD